MIIAVYPLVITIVGLLLWLLTSKASEIGRIMFIIGFFWLVYTLTGKTLRLG